MRPASHTRSFERAAAALIVIAALALPGCGGPGPVTLSDAWPERPGDYEDVHEAWTRNGLIRDMNTEALEVYATFKSPEWRAAYVAHTARQQRLSPGARAALEQRHKDEAASAYELHLLVTTYERKENDLAKGERSTWRLVLRDDRGNEVEPVEIERDRRPPSVVRAEFPEMGDFAVPYIVRFPRKFEILRDDSRHFSLIMANPRGAVELRWQAR